VNDTKNLYGELIFGVGNVIGKFLTMNKNNNDNKTFVISVTRNESLFLDDSLTLMIENSSDTQHVRPMRPISPVTGGGVPAPIELIQKVGKAVIYTCDIKNINKEYLLYIDEFELLILREISFSHVKYGAEMVGFNLKKKILASLLEQELKLEQQLNEVLSNIEQSKKVYHAKKDTPPENIKRSVEEILKQIEETSD